MERHHKGELINPDTLAMYKEKAPFIASTKVHLNREFFKHFGHFTNKDSKSYVQHLLGRTPRRALPYPKVTVHKTIHVHASHHKGHEWIEQRKRKKVVLEELEGLQDDLLFFKGDGSVDGDKWRHWKEEHKVLSATYNLFLYLPTNQYFSKRLTNEGKLKRAREFYEKFPDVLPFLRNFLRLKSNLGKITGAIKLRTQDSVSMALSRDISYQAHKVLGFALMDLQNAPTNNNSNEERMTLAFYKYVQKMLVMKNPSFTNPLVWLWIQDSEARANQCEAFVKQWLPAYDVVHSVYHSSKNERLNDAKTRTPLTTVHLVFLLKVNDKRATRLRGSVRREFTVPLEIPYYNNFGRYMEVKYWVYASELRMEFYFELFALFGRDGENFLGIHMGSKCMLAAKVSN